MRPYGSCDHVSGLVSMSKANLWCDHVIQLEMANWTHDPTVNAGKVSSGCLPLMDLLHCCATNPASNAAIFGWVCCNRSNRVKNRKPVVARYARKASRVAAINITEFCNNVRAHRDSECKQKWMWAKPSDANLWSTWCQVCKQNKQQDSICKQSEPVMQMCDLVDASEDKNMRAQL